jgi:death-on-curing protein
MQPTSAPKWRDERALKAMQAALAGEHGLAPCSADSRLLEKGLAEPRRMMTGGATDPQRLAAAYCAGVVRARPFAVANAALALMALYVTLRLGGYRLTAPETEAVAVIRDLEAARIGTAELEVWIERSAVPA